MSRSFGQKAVKGTEGRRSTHSEKRARIILPKVHDGADAAEIPVLAHGSPEIHTGTRTSRVFRHASGDEFPGSELFHGERRDFSASDMRASLSSTSSSSPLRSRTQRGSSSMTED